MSHVEMAKCEILDLELLEYVLKTECPELELVRDKKNFEWYGRWMNDYNGTNAALNQGIDPKDYGKCDHVVRFKGQGPKEYEIGLVKNKNGKGYSMVYDFFGSGNRYKRKWGEQLGGIIQPYATAAAKRELTKMGYQWREEKTKDGKVRLITI